MSYATENYLAEGGAAWVVGSAGTLTVAGTETVSGTLDITGTLKIGGVTADRIVKVARVALAAVDTAGGVISWANPEASAIIIERVVLDVTTAATAAATIDIGVTATSATTSADNLIDGLDVNTAAGVFDNITDKGTNGKSRQRVAVGKWVTGSKATGATAGLVGYAYIHYVVI